jgi:hypothetical protein
MTHKARWVARTTVALGLAALVVGSLVAPLHRADASSRNALNRQALGAMSLTDAGSFRRGAAAVAAVERSGAVSRVRLDGVLDQGPDATQPQCHEADVHVTTSYTAVCWSELDDATSHWYPQGITGSGDASNRSPFYVGCRGCPQRKVVAVSWHRNNRMARISFVDVTNEMSGARYGHVLLVEPERTARRFHRFRSHADGIVWYGHRLFLVSTGSKVIRVFDTRHIWQVSDRTSGNVGCDPAAATCAAAGAGFAMPQIGYYRYAGKGACKVATGRHACLNGVSLDRSTSPDSLVTVEYSRDHHGRVVRWPLDVRTTLLKKAKDKRVHPSEGWASAVRRVQGASFSGNRAIVSGLCQYGAPDVSYMPAGPEPFAGNIAKACLYRGTLSRDHGLLSLRQWTTAPANIQNMSYWPGNGRLWAVNEFRGSGAVGGDRLLLSFACPALACG